MQRSDGEAVARTSRALNPSVGGYVVPLDKQQLEEAPTLEASQFGVADQGWGGGDQRAGSYQARHCVSPPGPRGGAADPMVTLSRLP